jgi:hypothetical protein
VIDDYAKDYLYGKLRSIRQAAVWKLDGLSEYDARRPLTAAGPNLNQRAWGHAHATIEALALDAPGRMPWWSRPDVKLFSSMVQSLQATTRQAGYAGILREKIDGPIGMMPVNEESIDAVGREVYWANLERTAQEAAGGSHHADLSGTHRVVGGAVRDPDLVEARP